MEHTEYLVSYGKSGGFGRFRAEAAEPFDRGQRVVIRTNRGPELGTVLCAAKSSHQRALKDTTVGQLVREATPNDEEQNTTNASLAQNIFDGAREFARESDLPIEILDVDLVLDGSQATLHSLMWAEADLTEFTTRLRHRFGLVIGFEDLGLPVNSEEEEETHGGCGKPGCGHSSGGGCSSCGSGGCSSCGSGGVDMKDYFAHLRGQMEDHYDRSGRTPLL